MKFEKNSQYLDKYVWRYKSLNTSHYIKLNIRTNSIFPDIRTPLNVIYYLAFKCFITRKSLKKTMIHIKEFCATLNTKYSKYNYY